MNDRNGESVTLTREELYRRVWETPMQRLAEEFGVSDVGLAKICRRHQIPFPPRGYWAKKRHGKRVRQPPLPKPKPTTSHEVTINRHKSNVEDERSVRAREAVASAPPLKALQRLSRPHPIVVELLNDYEQRRQRWRAELFPWRRELLKPEPFKEYRRRCLILDALVKALAEDGYRIRADGWRFTIWHDKVSVSFSLDHNSAGTLALRLHTDSSGLRRLWSDTPTKRIEDHLPAVRAMLRLYMALEAERRLVLEADRAERLAAYERRVAEEAAREEARKAEERAREEEARRREGLLRVIQDWRDAEAGRELLEAIEAKVADGGLADDRLVALLEQIRRRVHDIDPLGGGIDRALSRIGGRPEQE